jgi:hypothetical protein
LSKNPKKKQTKLIVSVGLHTGERFAGEPTTPDATELKYLWGRDDQCVHLKDGDLIISIPNEAIAWMTRGPKTAAEIAQQKKAEIQEEIRRAAEEIRRERDAALAAAPAPIESTGSGVIQPGDERTDMSQEDRDAVADVLAVHTRQAGIAPIARHQNRIQAAKAPVIKPFLRRVAEDNEP